MPGHYSFGNVPPHRFQLYYWILHEALRLPVQVIGEIGIGSAVVSHVLSFNGKSVIKIDFDSSLTPNVTADVRRLPFRRESFDLVIASEVLEHIPFDDVSTALSELSYITKRYLIISVPYNQDHVELYLNIKINRYLYLGGRLNRLIRRLFPFHLSFGKDLSNVEFRFDGEHHWEIGYKGYPIDRIRELLSTRFSLVRELRVPLSPYHFIFVLEKRTADNQW